MLFFFAFLVSQAVKRETSPVTTGITSGDESKGVRSYEERRVDSKGIIGGARTDRGRRMERICKRFCTEGTFRRDQREAEGSKYNDRDAEKRQLGQRGASEAGQGVQGEGDSLGGRFGQHGKRIRPEG